MLKIHRMVDHDSYMLAFRENTIKFKEWKNGEGVQGALEKWKEI